MQANLDFKELLKILREESVEFLIVGAHAVIHYSEPRYTKDIEIWVAPTPENARSVYQALTRFGAPLTDISVTAFQDEDLVYQMGIPPNRIDLVMGVDGLNFDEAWTNRVETTYDGERMFILSRSDLIRNKQASGRPQDLLDVQRLLDD